MKKALNSGFRKDKNLKKGIFLMLIVTVLNGLGQLGFKMGMDVYSGVLGVFTNIPLLMGLALYGVSMILATYALKFGDLHILYPMISLTFIWVLLLSLFVLQEPIGVLDVAGIGLITGGVILIRGT